MHRRALAMLAAMTACGVDADFDGFSGDEDCDDADERVFPGAPDLPGDGIDADCDGEDPPYPFLGTWQLVDYRAVLFEQPVFEGVPVSGTISIADDLTASSLISFQAYGLDLEVDLAGFANPLPGEGAFNVAMDGTFGEGILDEVSSTDLDCEMREDPDDVLCEGSLLVLGANVLATLTFR